MVQRNKNISINNLLRLIEHTVEKSISNDINRLNEENRQHFLMEVPSDLKKISKIFFINNYELYIVGGAIRDALLGKKPKDYDVATNAKPDEVIELMAPYPEYKILEIGKSFGVISIFTPEANEYEVATFRADLSSGRRPDAVEFDVSMKADSQRRDLTINALFYDINKSEIIDYVGGIEDIHNGIIKSVGDPKERFAEDRLRILRAIRFAARMGSELDQETKKAILEDNSLSGVSPERIRDEFLKSIKTAKSVQGLLSLYDYFGLWPQVFKGLLINRQFKETNNIPILLALLMRNNESDILPKKLNSLKYNSTEAKQVTFLNMFQKLEPENAYKLKKLWKSTQLSEKDLEEFSRLNDNVPPSTLTKAFNKYQPSINGQDLLASGFKGRDLGVELERQETEKFTQLV